MTLAVFLALLLFVVVCSATPGPNNLMLMASGGYFGVRRTLPHMAGVVLGGVLMTVAVGLGLAGAFKVAPWLYLVLRWGGAAYLLYLAFRMATATGLGGAVTDINPMGFWHAAVFQWVNPKAWIMILGAVTTYADPHRLLLGVGIIAATFLVVGPPCVLAWTAGGAAIRRLLKPAWALRSFNWAMAALLIASLYPLITAPLGPPR